MDGGNGEGKALQILRKRMKQETVNYEGYLLVGTAVGFFEGKGVGFFVGVSVGASVDTVG